MPPAEWPYEAEEYELTCIIDAGGVFEATSLGDPVVTLHRFGGTYGPAVFSLRAVQSTEQASFQVTLVNAFGLPVGLFTVRGSRVSRLVGERDSVPQDESAQIVSESVTIEVEEDLDELDELISRALGEDAPDAGERSASFVYGGGGEVGRGK